MPETQTQLFSVPKAGFEADPRSAARRLRALARNLPPSKLDYAAELVQTAWELEFQADEKEKQERIAATGVQA